MAINFLLDNSYFKVGKKIFRQVIGIPMGTDPAPFMANLFLYFYEKNFVLQLKKENIPSGSWMSSDELEKKPSSIC